MDIDIMDSLEDLRYPIPLTDDAVQTLIKDGLSSLEFYKLIEWLTKELQELCQMESCVTPVTDIEDSASFLLEIRTFLKELQCPYDCLMGGPMLDCLEDKQHRIILLEYLCSELFSARIVAERRLHKKQALDIEMDSSTSASCLISISKTLGTDSEDKESGELFTEIYSKLEDIISENPGAVKEPAFTEELTEGQWEQLQDIQTHMQEEYTTRREMLLTRLDVIVESFKWGENVKGKEEKIHKIYHPYRKEMKPNPDVDISKMLAAREDVLIMEKTSSAAVRKNMESSVYKTIIPEVPDRGGRANEQRPPVEMPSWQKRSNDPRGGRGGFRGRGGRGDHRGGGRGGHYKGGGGSQSKSSAVYDAMGSYGST